MALRCYCWVYHPCHYFAVKSDELKWLPNGSEFLLATENSASNTASKQKTYTSFSSSQNSLPEFSNNPIAPKYADIIIAKLGPGQVRKALVLHLYMLLICC